MTVGQLFEITTQLRNKFLEGKQICETYFDAMNNIGDDLLSHNEKLILITIAEYTRVMGEKSLEILNVLRKYDNITDQVAKYDMDQIDLLSINLETEVFNSTIELINRC